MPPRSEARQSTSRSRGWVCQKHGLIRDSVVETPASAFCCINDCARDVECVTIVQTTVLEPRQRGTWDTPEGGS